jgi:hypothetical protein
VIGKPERGEARMEDTEVAFSLFASLEATAVADGCECAEFERHESSSSLLLASSGGTQRHAAFCSEDVEKAQCGFRITGRTLMRNAVTSPLSTAR